MAYVELINTSLYSDPSLVSYFRFEGNSNDTKAANNGTDTAITYNSGNGKVNQGAGFAGSSSIIDLGASATLNFTGDFTINLWINHTDSAEPYPGIFNAGGLNFIIVDDGTTNTPYYDVGDGLGADANTAGAAGSVTPGTYQMVTIRRLSGNMKIFVDAVLKSSNVAYSTNMSGSKKFGENPGRFFTGKMDEAAFFSRGLSDAEITNLYDGTYATTTSTTTSTTTTSTSTTTTTTSTTTTSTSQTTTSTSSTTTSTSMTTTSTSITTSTSSSTSTTMPMNIFVENAGE